MKDPQGHLRPSVIPIPKEWTGMVSAHWESHQTAKCCRKIHSKKATTYTLSFEKLAKIHSITVPGQGLTCLQNEGAAARLNAPTHLPFNPEQQDSSSPP